VEVADGETREVVCELANMMCGSALSRVDTKATFQLTHPEITAREQCGSLRRPAADRWFDLGVGMLTVSLELQKLS
jgi:hypothetical protein